jgi:CelD/BcsL family acetyltransferase involved in cellulose biosynthesis
VRVVEVREADGVRRLRAEWQALQAQCPDATPFQTWEWNEAWWQQFGTGKRLCLLLFYEERANALVGLAPFYIGHPYGTPLRRLTWLGTGHSDYLDALIRPAYAESVTRALFDYLEAELGGWDMADWQQMRLTSPLLQRSARPWPYHPADTQILFATEPCPVVSLPATWDACTARLGKKMRSNLGYYERLLLKTFPDARLHLADAATLDSGMDALFRLHQQRWNARWLPGVLGNKAVQRFHRDVAARFLAQGWLRLHLLYADGDYQAALYCYTYHRKTFYYLGGFAPDYGKYSLGTLLTGRALRLAIEEGCDEFDFLRGQEAYKYRWLPEDRFNQRMLLLRPRVGIGELPGRFGLALCRVERFVEHQAKAFAERQSQRGKTAQREPPDGVQSEDKKT